MVAGAVIRPLPAIRRHVGAVRGLLAELGPHALGLRARRSRSRAAPGRFRSMVVRMIHG
jgi:hypothetical protein